MVDLRFDSTQLFTHIADSIKNEIETWKVDLQYDPKLIEKLKSWKELAVTSIGKKRLKASSGK